MRDLSLTMLSDDDLARLLLIRHFELTLLDLFAREKLNGTTHTCLGQEYIPVALQPLLRDEDFVFSNHRGHGHYLARFGDPAGLLAEIMGRAGAVCRGVGGSQHIYRSNYLSTGIQGQSMPVAAGVAIHLKRTRPGALSVVYIGDGTWGEGAVYEALNIARLWCLPLLVVVENNHIAQSTPSVRHMAGSIAGRAAAFDIDYLHVTGVDINGIRATVLPHIQAARSDTRPLVLEFETVRIGPHSKGDDSRDAAELQAVHAHDWYPAYQALFPAQIARVEPAVLAELGDLAGEVEARPPVQWEGL